MINVKILTGYPEMFPGGLAHSLMGKALKENIFKSYLLYLIALVTFSSAVANQYLAIPLIAIAIYWNRFFLIYTIVSFSFF